MLKEPKILHCTIFSLKNTRANRETSMLDLAALAHALTLWLGASDVPGNNKQPGFPYISINCIFHLEATGRSFAGSAEKGNMERGLLAKTLRSNDKQ